MDVNHRDVVLAVNQAAPPPHTLDGALEFVVKVIARLPRDERAGLVRSFPGAEGTLSFHGVFVRVGRICYPDGTRYKILTDIPTTMAPAWNREDDTDASQYFDVSPFLDETQQPQSPPPIPPPPQPGGNGAGDTDDDIDELVRSAQAIVNGLIDTRNAMVEFGAKVDRLRTEGIPLRIRI